MTAAQLHEKVRELLAGDGAQGENIEPSHFHREIVEVIQEALSEGVGDSVARDVAFHLSDWSSDAAFLVALHLFPDRFSPEEIEAGVIACLVHAPNHLAAAAKLYGLPVQDVFELGVLDGEEDDESS